MNYTTLEQDITTRLNSFLVNADPELDTGISAMVLPEKESDVVTPFEFGLVVVCYKKSTYDPTRSTSLVCQNENIHVDVNIQSRTLHGPLGIHNIIALVKSILIGYKPTDCGKITAVDSSIVDFKENLWTYCLTIATTTLAVEKPDDETEVLLKWITLDGGQYMNKVIGTPVPIHDIGDPAPK